MSQESTPSGNLPSPFDRALDALTGRPDVVSTKPSTIRTLPVLGVGGGAALAIVQTFRYVSEAGSRDTIFLEHVSEAGTVRLVLAAEVADAIARQRDSLTDKSRSRAARKVAAERKARGEVPGFMRAKKRKK